MRRDEGALRHERRSQFRRRWTGAAPVRAAAVIRTVLEDADAPLRLPLGAEAVENLTASYQRSLGEVDRWATMSRSADYPEAARSERAFLA